MASLAVEKGKRDGSMTYTAVFAFEYLDHRVFGTALLHADEYLRMAYFAAVPDRMLLMEKMISGIPLTFASRAKSFWAASEPLFIETPSM